MRASLIEAIKNVEAEDAPRFNDCVYVDPAGVVDALVEWLRGKHQVEFANGPGEVERCEMTGQLIADLLSEET